MQISSAWVFKKVEKRKKEAKWHKRAAVPVPFQTQRCASTQANGIVVIRMLVPQHQEMMNFTLLLSVIVRLPQSALDNEKKMTLGLHMR